MQQFDFGLPIIENKLKTQYSTKVKIPIYTPHNRKPRISELVDERRYREIVRKINKFEISDKDKSFLLKAAARHRVFNYSLIADYYSHATKEIQELMEDSALVIIDFDKAIEQGFGRLSEDVAKQYKNDYPDDEK